MHRLRDYAAARGYQVAAEVTEIASGLNDDRPKLKKLLTNPKIGVLVVEHRDRLTRFGYGYIATLLEQQGRRVEAMFPPIRTMIWWMILWRSSPAWRRASMANATSQTPGGTDQSVH